MRKSNVSMAVLAAFLVCASSASTGCAEHAEVAVAPPPPPPAPPPPPPPPPAPEPPADAPEPPPVFRGAQLDLPGEVEFDVGSANIQETERTHHMLHRVVRLLRKYPNITEVRVEGHTDSDGDPQANKLLSQQRAAAVIVWLVAKGVDPARVHPVGCGATDPLVPNTSPENKAKNRRTEFDVTRLDGKRPDAYTEPCAPNPAR
jgi:OmpA-OmpF porin, OOP family